MNGEFDLIREHFTRAGVDAPGASGGVALSVGDDAALLVPTPGAQLVVTTDALVSGAHFLADADASDIGYKSAMVNLSDLAAMGAMPRWAQLALTLPDADESWVAGFAHGLFAALDAHGVALTGGDLTRGPLTVTLTLLGEVMPPAIMRAGARPGDVLLVTGSVGEAAAGLAVARGEVGVVASHAEQLTGRLHRPQARVAAGRTAWRRATAGIDISDGLLADLEHVLSASGVGAQLDANALPVSDALAAAAAGDADRLARWQWTGGDDYELLLAVAADDAAALVTDLRGLGLAPAVIGVVTAGEGVTWLDGAPPIAGVDPVSSGFRHF